MKQTVGPLLLAALLVLLVGACATARSQDASGQRANPNRLAAEEFANFSDAFEAVQALRPAWLRQRGTGGFQASSPIWVYRDGLRVGGIDSLSAMSTFVIGSIEFLDARGASQRWGIGHESGVIHVTSRLP